MKVLLILIVVLQSLHLYAAQGCIDSLVKDQHTEDSQSFNFIMPHKNGFVEVQEYKREGSNFTALVVRPTKYSDKKDLINSSNKNALGSAMDKLSSFLSENYKRRKWDHSFTKKVTSSSSLFESLENTTRIIIFDESKNIVGSFSIIYSLASEDQYSGLLPVENHFGIKINREDSSTSGSSDRLLVELGSFAVDHSHQNRRQILEEIYFNFLIQSYHAPFKSSGYSQGKSIYSETLFKKGKPFFFTYADRVGQLMYREFGFSKDNRITSDSYNVSWNLLANDSTAAMAPLKRSGMKSAAKDAFEFIESRLFVSNSSGASWMGLSVAEEMSDSFKVDKFRRYFFSEYEENMSDVFFDYTVAD